jgi:TonB family protein
MTTLIVSEQALVFLIACVVKATLLLACAWLFVSTLNKFSAAIRHHVWAATILASLFLPILVLLLPAWHSVALGNAAAFLGPPQTNATNSFSPEPTSATVSVLAGDPLARYWPLFVLLVWATGFCFVALRLLTGLLRLAWISSRAKSFFDDAWISAVLTLSNSFKIRRPVRLLLYRNPLAMPLTWGIFRPVIVLPASAAEWPANRSEIVLSHELAHISRHDWLLQICAELTRALYWFHPLIWLAAAGLRQESERACDDAVLRSGVAPSLYASQLLDLARTLESSGRGWSTALAIARPSNLERRFAAMLSPSVNRRHMSIKAKFFIPFFALCLLIPLAALRLPAQNLSGKTTGSVHDPSGAGIANATIIMSNLEANTIDMTTSDRDGNFAFKPLPAGTYELQVLKPGFKTFRVPQVSLDTGRDFSEAFTLDVGSLNEHGMVVPENSSGAAPVEAPSGKPSRLSIGGNIQAAKIILKVQPIYPESAKSAGIQGTVVLHAVISKDGKPLSLRVMNAQADPDLARSAVEAVSQWRYTPTLLNGDPIEIDTTIDIVYSLRP